MTLSAAHAQTGDCDDITVTATYGPATYSITENAGHLRAFWSQLGRVITEIDDTTPGERAYNRYREHSGGKSLISGQRLPEWSEQEPEIRAAWEHSAT